MVTSKKTHHQFNDTGSKIMVELFEDKSFIVLSGNIAHVWWQNKFSDQLPNKHIRAHRILHGSWNVYKVIKCIDTEVRPLAITFIDTKESLAHWSGVFLTRDKQNKLRLHYKTLQPRCQKKVIEEDDILKHVILEFEESLELDNHTAEFSPCRKMCAVFLHFKQKKVMGYVLHIMNETVYLQNVTSELDFMKENESVKCLDFTGEGILWRINLLLSHFMFSQLLPY